MMFLPTCVGCSLLTCDIYLFSHWLEGLCFLQVWLYLWPVSFLGQYLSHLQYFSLFLYKTNETLEKLLHRVWLHGTEDKGLPLWEDPDLLPYSYHQGSKKCLKKKKKGPRTWEAISKNLAFSTWDLKWLPKHTILTEVGKVLKKNNEVPSSIEKSLSFIKKKILQWNPCRAFAVPMETVCSADGLHT